MENYLYIIKLISYFIIYSFFGWVMESVLKTYLQKKPVNSGFLYGPFCPIYGFGAIFMFLFLQGFKDNIVLLFIIAFFSLSLWEYVVGWLLEKIFHTKYWDYTENKFNIRGRVCLMNSLFWGFLGVIFIRYVNPFISKQIDMIPQNILTFNVIMILIAMIVDTIVSVVKVINIQDKLEKLKEITNTIKEKLEELEKKQVNKESLQAAIEELKYKQTVLKRKLIRQTNHLKKAFPTIKSEAIEKITEYLKEKKENTRKHKN
ncbi:MAG: putative ABC transporter permease [Clostridia bacterium]|nr:putative ABC transporter permease [Clostridia bacterium]